MSFGFRSYADSSIVQIDENSAHMQVTEVGRIPEPHQAPFAAFGTFLYAYPSYPPLVFVKPDSNGQVGLFTLQGDGSGYTGFVCICTTPFDFRVVSSMDNLPSIAGAAGTYGMQVRGETGAVAYDSRSPYMQVQSICNVVDQSPGYADFTVPTSGDWFLANNLRVNIFVGEFDGGNGYVAEFTSSSNLRISHVDAFTGSTFASFDADVPPIMVLTARF
jgi:hypothetical protein